MLNNRKKTTLRLVLVVLNLKFLTVPGVAGHAGAEDCVQHGDREVPLMEEAIHPLVRENIC